MKSSKKSFMIKNKWYMSYGFLYDLLHLFPPASVRDSHASRPFLLISAQPAGKTWQFHLAEVVLPFRTVERSRIQIESGPERRKRRKRTHTAQHSRDHPMECLGKLARGAGDTSVSTVGRSRGNQDSAFSVCILATKWSSLRSLNCCWLFEVVWSLSLVWSFEKAAAERSSSSSITSLSSISWHL